MKTKLAAIVVIDRATWLIPQYAAGIGAYKLVYRKMHGDKQ